MNRTIAVVDYGMGNIHSIIKALRLYSDDVIFSADPRALEKSAALVLPGDGAFAAAMRHLEQGGLRAVVERGVAEGKPLLGVCIGFQVLFADSDEFSRDRPRELVAGLGLVPGHIRRFESADGVRVPHMGWNQLRGNRPPLSAWEEEYMYFIHSYRAVRVPEEYVRARADYAGESFPAAVARDAILGVQFHPEKSHTAGLALLKHWVEDYVHA